MDKTEIKFLRPRDYKFIREIDQGGFGKTILIEDELINEQFVCKKYSPMYKEDEEIYFKNFVQEIKLLHLLNHRNIVRVFNYYLYPEKYTGYILMEFINGKPIQEYIKSNPDEINEIFSQTIEGFKHLEELNILHRDIRPQNILISAKGTVKIIDFGFGKKVEFEDDDFDKSITLNWRYSPPAEFKNKIYNFRTEIFFIGKLFEEILNENRIENFAYVHIIKKMSAVQYDERIASFFDVNREILKNEFSEIEFDEIERMTYVAFADRLSKIFSFIYDTSEYVSDIQEIIEGLENAYRVSMLEKTVQNNSLIANCFVKGRYKYFKENGFELRNVRDFINFLKNIPIEKQKIVLNNIWQRLDAIGRINEDIKDLPF